MDKRPIGIFDSGIGGITVLAKAMEILPGERFIYFGDSGNAPYGIKETKEVLELTKDAANFFLKKGVKALVIACNTATSAAIQYLRNNLDIPVIGMEPALKPAVETGKGGAIGVMATPLTLKEKKFNMLMKNYLSKANILALPCPGLVELIESGVWEGAEIQNYLSKRFSDLDINDITDIVLGCTHYIFIKDEANKFFNNRVRIIDGNEGTARQVRRVLTARGLYKQDLQAPEFNEDLLEFYFSSTKDKVLELCKNWVKVQIKNIKR